MTIERKLNQRLEPQARVADGLLSPCHSKPLVTAPVILLQRDGSGERIGVMRYCHTDEWTPARVHVECYKPVSAHDFRNWPDSLTKAEVMKICNHYGPEYWLESGFHIFQWEGVWTTLRAFALRGGLPPWARRDFAGLVPQAQRLVRILSKAMSSGRFGKAFSEKWVPAPKPVPKLRMKNAGLAKKQAKNLAEQLVQAKEFDHAQRAAGEHLEEQAAYEPGLEPGQYEEPFLSEDQQRLLDAETEARIAFEKDEMARETTEPTRIPPAQSTAKLEGFFDVNES